MSAAEALAFGSNWGPLEPAEKPGFSMSAAEAWLLEEIGVRWHRQKSQASLECGRNLAFGSNWGLLALAKKPGFSMSAAEAWLLEENGVRWRRQKSQASL